VPDELCRFQSTGPSWAERAEFGELKAVLDPGGSKAWNGFLHSTQLGAAKIALGLNHGEDKPVIVDFGCGVGRWVRFFGERGASVVGIDITPEMLREAKKIGLPKDCSLVLTDGINIPLPDQSVNMVWCCGVLRFSLFVPDPVYRDIAVEMYRVLKPGGVVVNIEMYVDNPPEVFSRDFEDVGFITNDARVLHRYGGRPERFFLSPRMPMRFTLMGGRLCSAFRLRFDSATRQAPGLRDYLFVWSKEETDPKPSR
jgi:SAM-dependent methyltransferase